MIRITDKSTKQPVYFNKLKDINKLHLVLVGIGENIYDIIDIDDLNQYYIDHDIMTWNDFYELPLYLADIPDGEYKWFINDYECGLMLIGDIVRHSKSLPDVDKVKQYEYKNYKAFE